MQYLIVAFKSRTQTIRFSEDLKRIGEANTIVNTPKEALVGCGLSVKISESSIGIVRNMLNRKNYHSFAGVFLVSSLGNKIIVRPY